MKPKLLHTLAMLIMVAAAIVMSQSNNIASSHAASRSAVHERGISPNNSQRIIPTSTGLLSTSHTYQSKQNGASSSCSGSGLSQFDNPPVDSKLPEPSDVNVSAGTNNLLETVNTAFAVYDFNHCRISNIVPFSKWLNYAGGAADPRVIFDPVGKRFIMLIDEPDDNAIVISVAQQSSAAGKWCKYTVPTLQGYLPDFPTLGVDNNGIYFSVNLFNLTSKESGLFTTSQLFEMKRMPTESCQPAQFWDWHDNLDDPDCFGAGLACRSYSITPAVTHDTSPYEYLVNSRPRAFGLYSCKLTFRRLDGAVPMLYSAVSIDTKACYSNPPKSPQKGTNVKLSSGDASIYQASYMKDLSGKGLIDTALTSGDTNFFPHNSIVRWYKIDPSNPDHPSITQQGTIGNTGDTWYFYPAIQQDVFGNAALVYDTSSASSYESIRYSPVSNQGMLGKEVVLKESSTYYDDGGKDTGTARWGDYQSAVLDANDNRKIWVAGQRTLENSKNVDYWSTFFEQVYA